MSAPSPEEMAAAWMKRVPGALAELPEAYRVPLAGLFACGATEERTRAAAERAVLVRELAEARAEAEQLRRERAALVEDCAAVCDDLSEKAQPSDIASERLAIAAARIRLRYGK